MRKLTWLMACCAVMLFAQSGTALAASPLNNTLHNLIGVKYRWGGTSASGFDCSGLVAYVYKRFGVTLPHSSRLQAGYGKPVTRANLRPGDLVFFHTYTAGISHVGIYVGNNNFIHASDSGVIESALDEPYYAHRYVTARRVLNHDAFEQYADNSAATKASSSNG